MVFKKRANSIKFCTPQYNGTFWPCISDRAADAPTQNTPLYTRFLERCKILFGFYTLRDSSQKHIKKAVSIGTETAFY